MQYFGLFARRRITLRLITSFFPHVLERLPQDGFSWNVIFGISIEICRQILFPLKLDKNKWRITWTPKHIYGLDSPLFFVTYIVFSVRYVLSTTQHLTVEIRQSNMIYRNITVYDMSNLARYRLLCLVNFHI